MAGKKEGRLPQFPHIGSSKARNSYGYVTSETALKDKEELLNGIFENLKRTGDIEGCLSSARNPALRQAELRNAYTGGSVSPKLTKTEGNSSLDEMMNRLKNVSDDSKPPIDYADSLDSNIDTRPPKE